MNWGNCGSGIGGIGGERMEGIGCVGSKEYGSGNLSVGIRGIQALEMGHFELGICVSEVRQLELEEFELGNVESEALWSGEFRKLEVG